jgi:hypothetical protein
MSSVMKRIEKKVEAAKKELDGRANGLVNGKKRVPFSSNNRWKISDTDSDVTYYRPIGSKVQKIKGGLHS